jgi:predicted O-linked N-acetylglucosamine transferase (SPINDLY family)
MELVQSAANALNTGRAKEAEPIARALVDQHTDYGFGWTLLGASLRAQGKNVEALTAMQQASTLSPNTLDCICNVGAVLFDLGRYAESEAYYLQAAALAPLRGEVHYFLGNAQVSLKHYGAAEQSYQRAIELQPDLYVALYNLGLMKAELGDDVTAKMLYEASVRIAPGFAEAFCSWGETFKREENWTEAERYFRKAIDLKSDYAAAYGFLGEVLKALGREQEGQLATMRAVEIALFNVVKFDPDNASAQNNLGIHLYAKGQLADAERCYRRAIELDPRLVVASSNLLFLYAREGQLGTQAYLHEARQWDQRVLSSTERVEVHAQAFIRKAMSARRMRVGYLSGDFREHVVSYFIEPLFQNHDKSRVEVFAYSALSKADDTTLRLRAMCDHWRDVSELSDEDAAVLVRQDDLDILVDLSGHTAHNRLGIVARRVAPVQAHYLGYFASTGLSQMDYWLGDLVLTPSVLDTNFTETVWRLPRISITYHLEKSAPEPQWCLNRSGELRLGSFNDTSKLTPGTLELWARVMLAMPQARLLLKTKGLQEEVNRDRIVGTLTAFGVEAERITLLPRTQGWEEHMSAYDEVDIALDPVGGQGGATTTCDALWMGVPVITLAGDRVGQRMSAALVDALGHPEWIAANEQDYIDKVVQLAAQADLRQLLRPLQRQKMRQSPICNPTELAQVLESAYESMFDAWWNRQ